MCPYSVRVYCALLSRPLGNECVENRHGQVDKLNNIHHGSKHRSQEVLVAETYLHSVLTSQQEVEARIARDTLPAPRVEKRIRERAGGGRQARAWAKGEREGQSQREERLQKAAQKRTRATSAWNIYVKDECGHHLAPNLYSERMQ